MTKTIMSNAYIYDHVRTPRGKGRPTGALHRVSPTELLAQVLVNLRERSGFDTALVEDVISGCGSPVGEQGSAIGRTASLYAGYSETTPGQQVHRFCSSGLEAVNIAAAKVMSGQCELTIGCGVESMSRSPIGSSGGSWSSDPAVAYKNIYIPQVLAADLISSIHGYSREDVDAYSAESHRRAACARANGYFDNSLVPVRDSIGSILLSNEEMIREGTSIETLGALSPVFASMGASGYDQEAISKYPGVEAIEHVHTAGNSSGIADGAAAVLIGSKAIAEQLGLTPRARIRSFASVGTDPTIMLTGPTPSA
ncbi:MAG: acetyl-CoA C-acyltransferase, partial [Shewanella algae]